MREVPGYFLQKYSTSNMHVIYLLTKKKKNHVIDPQVALPKLVTKTYKDCSVFVVFYVYLNYIQSAFI